MLKLEVGKSYLSKANMLVLITHKRDDGGVLHYTGNNLRLYHEDGTNFIPQSSSDASPVDHLVTEVERASNVTEVGQVLLSKMLKAFVATNLYNKWFRDVLIAWCNPLTDDITPEDARDRVEYIIEHTSQEAKQVFMYEVINAFEKLMKSRKKEIHDDNS